MTYTATYSPDDNKLRLYASSRLDAETYARVKGAGFRWAPKQELWVAPAWSPAREDLVLELAGEIDDEDSTLVERAEARADRFEDYSASRQRDGDAAAKQSDRLAEAMNGQPILVGHHSEKRHRKDIARMQDATHKACEMWRTSVYWTQRAAGSIRAAKYKERPDVRARRIKGLEADLRRQEKNEKRALFFLRLWESLGDDAKWNTDENGLHPTMQERAVFIAERDSIYREFSLADYPRQPDQSQYEGSMSVWSALGGGRAEGAAFLTWEQARDIATATHTGYLTSCRRWIAHYNGRLAYERAMLADQGGTVADRTRPEVGGGVYCWATRRRGSGAFSWVVKVNKVSVTVNDNWGNASDQDGSRNFTRTIPFDKLGAIVTRADVAAAKERGALVEFEDKTGFYIAPATAVELVTEGGE